MTQPLFEHRRRFGDFDTRVLELEGSGPPLVLMHGYADSADTWRPLLAELARRERMAFAVDLPGFGTADLLGDGPVLPQMDAFASALLAHVAERAGEPAVVAGNSLGGAIALRLAERAGRRLAGIVPIAPAGLGMARWLDVIERDPLMRTVLALPTPMPERAVRAVVAQVYRALAFAVPAAVDPGVVSTFTSHHRTRGDVARYHATAQRLLPELRDPFALERVRCPVLMIWGERDRLVSPSGAEIVLDAVPSARLALLRDCGHCPQIEATERVIALLDDFPVAWAKAA
jgi:pimeloyl-ACP methyl ester carboxylesterase